LGVFFLLYVLWPIAGHAQTTVDFEQFGGPCCFTEIQPPLTVGIATFSGGQLLRGTNALPANQTTVYGTANPYCVGCLPAIHIAFAQPVSNFSVRVMNGNTVTVTYTVSDDQGGSRTLTLVANFLSGAGRITLPSTNIRSVDIAGGPAPSGCCSWDFFIDDVNFEPTCALPVTRQSQTDHRWGSQLYDHSQLLTIGEKGCALTSLSMALNFAGLATNPGALNSFMAATDRDYNGLSVNWDPAARDISGGTLKFHPRRLTGPAATQYLDATVCQQGQPVIVGVNLDAQGIPGHFVVVTGKVGADFQIADPGSNRTRLSQYGNVFETRGFVADPPGDISSLNIAIGNGAEFLIVDPLQRRTGLEQSTSQIVEDIPNSSYFRDALDNDLTGLAATDVSHAGIISSPVLAGDYQVIVTGTKLGNYSLSIRGFYQDGSPAPYVTIPGIAAIGSTTVFSVHFESSIGRVPRVQRVATFPSALADVSNALQLGLIDNRGIATSLSQKLRAAENASEPARSNILLAFIQEVLGQAGKHIQEPAAQIFLQNANSLRGR